MRFCRRIMKKLVVIFIASFICNIAFAENKNKKAHAILDAVIAKTEAQKTMEVEFTMTLINDKDDVNDSMSGTVQIMGNSYRLNMNGMTIISDGKTTWNLIADDEEVMINSVEDNEESITPQNLLNEYKANYKARFVKEYELNGKIIQNLFLVPIKGRKFTKIDVIVDKKENLILSFSIFNKDGNLLVYKINKYDLEKNIPASNFIFNEADYSDWEIVDMR